MFTVSHHFGYGLLDVDAMVTLAQNWSSVPDQHRCEIVAKLPARYTRSVQRVFSITHLTVLKGKKVKVKADIVLNEISELRDVTCHMGSQCYLPPDTSERAPPNSSHAGWYSIYLPRRDGRLS